METEFGDEFTTRVVLWFQAAYKWRSCVPLPFVLEAVCCLL